MTEALQRLRAILKALDGDFQDRPSLLEALADIYPDNPTSARRMFERDIDALEMLGFLVAKTNTRPPRYRLAGHQRFGPTLPDDLKRCPRCRRTLDRRRFPVDTSRSDGLYPYCNDCNRANYRAWYLDHKDHLDFRERRAARKRAIYRTPTGRERERKYARRYYQKNRAHILARNRAYHSRPDVRERRKETMRRYYQRRIALQEQQDAELPRE